MTTVLDAVYGVTSDARERLALLMGALLEGGSLGAGPFTPGDNGTSYGPWQFHFTGPTKLGLTPQQASDPAQAAAAILPSYSAAVKRVPDSLWQSSPSAAAATAAFYAEQPAYMYPADRVANAWQTLSGGGGAPVDSSGAIIPVGGPGNPFNLLPNWLDPRNIPTPDLGGIGSAASTIVSPFTKIADVFAKLADPSTWWRVLFVVAGAALVLVGLGIINGKQLAAAGERAALAA